jgi:hypothetical protein
MRICSFVFLLLALGRLASAQETDFAVGPQYLITFGSPLFARPIVPPSYSFDLPPAETVVPSVGSDIVHEPSDGVIETPSELQGQADLQPIFYGVPPIPVVVIGHLDSSEERGSSANVPASIGVSVAAEMTDVESLRQRGYGVTLAEAAGYWKSHKVHAPRVYTNEDVTRLRGGV